MSVPVTIVIPTYNEKDNLELLVKSIYTLQIPNVRIMVVDDSSPDGTGLLAEKLGSGYPLSVVYRPEKGSLGGAYTLGFQEALKHTPDYIIQMDADLSHDPATIPDILKKIESCDVVIGSRYVHDGRIEKWGAIRKGLSYFGNLYSRMLLGVPYYDMTTGFKCYRREALEKILMRPLSARGYDFNIEVVYRAHCEKLRIVEIPIVFTERKRGRSKISLINIVESFFTVLILCFSKK
jgi:dolichol-phosphate mannosyltransferase